MKEEKQQMTEKVETVKPIMPVVPEQKKPTTMEGAIRAGIASGRHFKLVRKVFQGKNGKFYYGYSVIVMLQNAIKCREIRLLPDIGYTGNDSFKTSASNSSGYSMLNLMYDFGGGANLILKEEKIKDRYGNVTDVSMFNFYAVSSDVSGVQQEYSMKPSSPGDRSMLLGAFSGFGGVRDWTEEDRVKVPELAKLFEGYYPPGATLEVDVENY